MCAAPNSVPTILANSSSTQSNPKRNKPSHDGKNAYMNKQQGNSAKPNGPTRSEKRARWAKKSRPVAKPIVKSGPAKTYVSLCCNLPAQKPAAGEKVSMKDHESGKLKTTPKGLGHWRCSGCRKIAKVSAHKPEPKVVAVDMAKVELRVVE